MNASFLAEAAVSTPKRREAPTLLMFAWAFPPQNVSGAKRPFRMAKYLPEFGVNVEVVTAGGQLPGWDNVHSTRVRTEERRTHQASRFLEFTQRWCLPYNDVIPWIPYAVAASEDVLSHSRVTAVLSTSPPIGSHLAALEAKRRHGFRWIADFRDPLLGNPFRNRTGAWIYDGMVERLIFQFADAVVANTDVMAECWRRRYPRWAGKIHVIWNGYDPAELVEPLPIEPRAFKVMAHVGAIYGGRVPTTLLRALGRLIGSSAVSCDLQLQLIGKLDPPDLLQREPGLGEVLAKLKTQYTGEVLPEAQAREAMARADYLCLLDNNDKNAGLQVPAKLFDYIRIGRPILAVTSRNSPAHRVLTRSGIPNACIFPDHSELEIDEILGRFLQLPNTPVRASSWFWETFDGRSQTGQLVSILERLQLISTGSAKESKKSLLF